MKEYHKIQSVFKRDEKTKKFIEGDWSIPELAYLHDKPWTWDEKIDGTNIRVHLDEYCRKFGGRTDNANIPAKLIARLEELFTIDKLREHFGAAQEGVTLYGEGFGAGIQSGGNYSPTQDFILFDVKIGTFWLERENVEDIASKLGLRVTPMLGEGTVLEAIEKVRGGFQSTIGTGPAEGLILRPKVQLFNRKGERIVTKVKTRDFR